MIKRIFDLALAFILLLLLWPILIFVAAFLRFYLGKGVIFKQKRVGLSNKVFEIYKFRTMKNLYNSKYKLLPDSERLTSLGIFLRKTSLDELPSLINILKGDMSFVGPRPFIAKYLPLYSETQKKRHNVRPGITGWAQINGRNGISWQEKFNYDLWYVENSSFFLDLKIIVQTVLKVLKRESINSKSHTTCEEFKGNYE